MGLHPRLFDPIGSIDRTSMIIITWQRLSWLCEAYFIFFQAHFRQLRPFQVEYYISEKQECLLNMERNNVLCELSILNWIFWIFTVNFELIKVLIIDFSTYSRNWRASKLHKIHTRRFILLFTYADNHSRQRRLRRAVWVL